MLYESLATVKGRKSFSSFKNSYSTRKTSLKRDSIVKVIMEDR